MLYCFLFIIVYYSLLFLSNTICDIVLKLLYERLSISLIYDGTIPLQYLKNSSCFEVSTLPEIGNQYMFLKWVALMWERGVKSKQRRMNLFCSVRSFFFRFLLSRGNLDVQLESKWGWIKALHGNLYNVDSVCQTQLLLWQNHTSMHFLNLACSN